MRAVAGIAAGFGIDVVTAIMGVAGGEPLIPTIVLLYAIDIKTAGSLSLLVSLPTMRVAFARYSRDSSFTVLRANLRFIATMTAGSITGALLGGAAPGNDPRLQPHPRSGHHPEDLRRQTGPPRSSEHLTRTPIRQ